MSRDKNVPNWDRCQFCIAKQFVKPLNLHGAAIGPLGAFSASVNVAISAAVGPVPNSIKAGAAGASALLALPSRSLVGFLSLLNGLLSPTEENEIPATAPPSAKPHTTDFPPRRSGENEKGEKNIPGPQTESAGSAPALPLQTGPQLSAAPALAAARPSLAIPAPESAVPSQIRSFAGFPQISREITGSTISAPDTALAAPLQPSGSVDKSTTGVAFALRLTPQNAPANNPTVSVPQAKAKELSATRTAALVNLADVYSASAKRATPPEFTRPVNTRQDPLQVSSPQRPASSALSPTPSSDQASAKNPQHTLAPTPLAPAGPTTDSDVHSGTQVKNVEPVSHPEIARPGSTTEVSPLDFTLSTASHEIDSPSRAPESIDVSKPTHESPQVVYEADIRPNIAADQPLIETPETSAPSDPAITTIDSATEKEQTRSASPVGSGTPRIAARNKSSTEPGNTSVKPHADSPKEPENSQGEEMSDTGSGAKSAKPDSPEKPTPNQKDIHVQEGTGLLAVLPSPANGASRSPQRSETSQADPPSAGRVSTEIETNPSVRPQPIREIFLRLSDKASNPVDIQMVERGGHVQVAVRTPDQELTKSLQTNLGELVGRLEQKGYKTETWVPGAPLHASTGLTESASSSGHSQDQPGHSSSWDGGQQQRQEHQESGRRQQARWMTQLEQTLDGEDAGTEGTPMEDQ